MRTTTEYKRVNMARKMAISTSDGKTVHQHFGHTKEFRIVSVDENGYKYIETRDVTPCCNQAGHNESAFDAVLSVLRDCEAVIVGRIGVGASNYLISKGMRVFEVSGIVDEILTEFAVNYSRYFPKEN